MFVDPEALKRDIEKMNKEKSEVKKLQDEVAFLKAESAKKEKKKSKIPWFAAGFFGTDLARKLGLTNERPYK